MAASAGVIGGALFCETVIAGQTFGSSFGNLSGVARVFAKRNGLSAR
jgi:hypothetical protein